MSLKMNIVEILNKFSKFESDEPKCQRQGNKFYTFDARNYICLFQCKDSFPIAVMQDHSDDGDDGNVSTKQLTNRLCQHSFNNR